MIAVLSRKKYLTRFSIGDILHIMVKNGMSEAAIRSRMEAIERELVKKKQLMLEYKRCRLIEFFKPYKWQREALEVIRRSTITVIPAPNKIGKGMPYWEPVLCIDGWREIGSLVIGDRVYSQDGNLTEINGVFNRGKRAYYKVMFDDGSWCNVDGEHLWKVQFPSNRFEKEYSTYGEYVVKSTAELIEYMGKHKAYGRHISIPMCEPINFPSKTITIEPYLLGLLLGDGCLRDVPNSRGGRQSSVLLTTMDPEVLDSVSVPYSKRKYRKCDYSFRGLGDVLRGYVLHGKKSWEKFIPDEYLYNDKEVRFALLQGLLDADGSIYGKYGSSIEYCSTSQRLAEGVKFLVMSFGGKAEIKSRVTSYTYKGEKKQGRVSYRVHISMGINPFRIKRKADRFKVKSRTHNRIIREIAPMGETECVCISVKNKSKLYITRDFIVTHNTSLSLCTMFSWLLGFEPWCRVDEGYPGAVRDGNIFYRASSLGIKPPVRIRLTGEDWDSHFGTSLIPEMNKWMVMPVNYNPEEVELGKHFSPWLKSAPKKTKDVPRLFEFKNGSILDLMTYKQDIKLFESWKGDGWIADEPPPQEIFESTSARGLFLSQGKVLMAITPLSNPWILDELILSGRKDVGVMDGLTILDNEDVVRDDTEVLKNAGLSDGEIAQYFQMLINYEGKTKVEHLREVDTFLENAILKRAA